MDSLKAMQAFTAVVRGRSYAAAADSLGVSRAVVTKYVMQLENHLGARLLNRTTRRVSTTEVGEEYFSFCTRVLAEIRDAEAAIGLRQREAEGMLKIMAPKSFGSLYLGKVVADFSRLHPNIGVSLLLTDLSLRSVDLVEQGFDLGIRLTAPADSSLVSRRLCGIRWVLCAAPVYLAAKGAPTEPGDLKDRACLLHYRSLTVPTAATWTFLKDGHSFPVRLKGNHVINSVMALRQAALEGSGLALLPTYCVGADLHSGELVRVMDSYEVAEEQVSVIFPHRNLLPMKSRLMIDFLVKTFRIPPWS
ncbi:MAG: LysR family transcriptional regulator [Alphaproteobacteria bacterium]